MAAEIKKVVIQIGKREIELSVEDAKALKDALDGMFEKARTEIIHVPQPYPVYTKRWDWPYHYEIWCGTGSAGTKWESKCDNNTAYLAVNQSISGL